MSTDIATIHNTGSRKVDISVCKYYGGKSSETCYQLTAQMENGEYGYVQLTKEDFEILSFVLNHTNIDSKKISFP